MQNTTCDHSPDITTLRIDFSENKDAAYLKIRCRKCWQEAVVAGLYSFSERPPQQPWEKKVKKYAQQPGNLEAISPGKPLFTITKDELFSENSAPLWRFFTACHREPGQEPDVIGKLMCELAYLKALEKVASNS